MALISRLKNAFIDGAAFGPRKIIHSDLIKGVTAARLLHRIWLYGRANEAFCRRSLLVVGSNRQRWGLRQRCIDFRSVVFRRLVLHLKPLWRRLEALGQSRGRPGSP